MFLPPLPCPKPPRPPPPPGPPRSASVPATPDRSPAKNNHRPKNSRPAASMFIKAKVCLVGEASVGKTSLARRFVLDQFDDRYLPTMGAKVTKKEIVLQPEGTH